jgi:hypothetical protein
MENKKTVLQKLSGKILEWDAQLDGLKGVAAEASTDIKKEYADQITELKRKKNEVELKIEKIKKSSDEGLDELTVIAEKAINELSDAIGKTMAKFKK